MALRRRIRRLRAGRSLDESGVSILELVMATSVLALIMTSVMVTIVTVTSAVTSASTLGQAANSGNAVMSQLSAQIVSADVIFNPATEGSNAGDEPGTTTAIPAGFSFRALTEVNGASQCVQWRLLTNDELEMRTYSNNWSQDGVVGGWQIEASNIVNPSTVAPFSLVSGGTGSNYGYRLLQVNLELNTGTTRDPGTPVDLQSSITARDAEYYRPPSADTQDCSPVPSP